MLLAIWIPTSPWHKVWKHKNLYPLTKPITMPNDTVGNPGSGGFSIIHNGSFNDQKILSLPQCYSTAFLWILTWIKEFVIFTNLLHCLGRYMFYVNQSKMDGGWWCWTSGPHNRMTIGPIKGRRLPPNDVSVAMVGSPDKSLNFYQQNVKIWLTYFLSSRL